MKTKAYAKLNLTLNVLGKIGEYHQIDSIAVTVNIFDEVKVTLRDDHKIKFDCDLPDCPFFLNSAYRAATEFRAATGVGSNISIKKHIPVGGGLGGSSADAAAVLYCLQKLTDADPSIVKEIAATVGSDVNFLMVGGYGRMRGKGDEVTPVECNLPMHFVVIDGGASVSAKDAYAAWDKVRKKPVVDCDEVARLLQSGDRKAFGLFGNALRPKVTPMLPNYRRIARFCHDNVFPLSLTGSGGSLFIPVKDMSLARDLCKRLEAKKLSARICSPVAVGVEEE